MKTRIPARVTKLLEDRGIKQSDILCVSGTDMNKECEYAEGYLILTREKLVVACSQPQKDEPHRFRGSVTRGSSELSEAKEWVLFHYKTDDIERFETEGQICCNLLLMYSSGDADDMPVCIAAFSNMHKRSVNDLIRRFKNRMEEQADTDKDDDDFCPVCGTMYPDRDRHVCPKCMDRKTVFFRTLRYFKPYRMKLTVMLICCVLTAVLGLVWPYLNGTVLFDYVLKKDNRIVEILGTGSGDFITCLFIVVLTMFMVKLTMLLVQILQSVLTAKIVSGVVCDLKKDIFNTMGRLSISFFRSRQTGSLMTRVLSDADRITEFFIDGAPYLVINSFIIITTVVVMFTIKWQMAVVACLMIPLALLIGIKLRPVIWILYSRRHRAERALNSQVNDNLTGARVVKAFGQESQEIDRFEKSNKRLRSSEISIARFRNYFALIYNSTQEIMSIIIYTLGVYFMLGDEHMELGVLITFIGYVGQLSGPMNFFSRVFHWWADSINSAQRMFEILDAIPEITEDENPIELDNPRGEVELRNVTFGYNISRPVLRNINMKIKGGSMLGIVGRSGAGKTTMVNLISRMYDTQEGSIYIDGTDIRKLSFRSLRKNVAMVSQETYIFMGTVEENIAYANPDATKEEIVNAAVLASAHEFIMRMPDGYDTIIGSSGRALSGGERQRISIARAILANPGILILDEATASVDTETERAIQRSIRYLIKGRTTISIAHRLSTLRDADELVVIDNGEITEHGTAKELAELKGTYYKLMELQTKALALKGIE